MDYGQEGINRNPLNALFLLYEDRFKPYEEEEKEEECKETEAKFEWTRASARKAFLSVFKTDRALDLVSGIKVALTPLYDKHRAAETLSREEFLAAVSELPLN